MMLKSSNSTLLENDASPPLDVDDDYDSDKHSKMRRSSRQFFVKWMAGMIFLTVLAVAMGRYHSDTDSGKNNTVAVAAAVLRTKNIAASGGTGGSVAAPAVSGSASGNHYDEQEPQNQQPEQRFDFHEIDQQLASKVDALDQKVRDRKANKDVIMETDPVGLQLTQQLQQTTLELLQHRYGKQHKRFRVRVDVVYPDSIRVDTKQDQFIIELAPHTLIPCSVFYFLEMVRTYQGGKFHRNAGHVLQAEAKSTATKGHKSMPFQEYNAAFPHAKYTTGYAGRPSGPGWYVSIQDNTKNHGPGSQQKHNPYEADSIFGKLVLDEHTLQVIQNIHSVPQNGWLDPPNHIKIPKMTLLVPKNDNADHNDENKWIPWTSPGERQHQEEQ
jgi:hypothetical protein